MSVLTNLVCSPQFYYSIIRVSTPLILASLGAVITSNAGITNIGIEGVMLTSALVAVLASAFGFGPWFGFVCAIVCGVICSLLIGVVTMKLKTDNVLTCIAFNSMAVGGTVYIMYAIVKDKGTTLSLDSGKLPNVNLPIIGKIPVIGQVISNHNIVSYLSILMIIVVYLILYKTPLGLKIRAAGKSPHALSSVGVSLDKIRYIALGISGILGGMGGAFMSLGYVTWFSKNMIAGRGFIALAADAMGNSTPIGASVASVIFAIAEASSFSLQITKIAPELIQMIPYLVTILGLIIFSVKDNNKIKKESMRLYHAK